MNPIVIFLFLGILVLSLVVVPIVNKLTDDLLSAVATAAAVLLLPGSMLMVWAANTEYQRIESTVIDVRPSASSDSSDSMLIERGDGQGQIISRVDRGSDHPDAGDQVVVITNQLGLTYKVEPLQK